MSNNNKRLVSEQTEEILLDDSRSEDFGKVVADEASPNNCSSLQPKNSGTEGVQERDKQRSPVPTMAQEISVRGRQDCEHSYYKPLLFSASAFSSLSTSIPHGIYEPTMNATLQEFASKHGLPNITGSSPLHFEWKLKDCEAKIPEILSILLPESEAKEPVSRAVEQMHTVSKIVASRCALDENLMRQLQSLCHGNPMERALRQFLEQVVLNRAPTPLEPSAAALENARRNVQTVVLPNERVELLEHSLALAQHRVAPPVAHSFAQQVSKQKRASAAAAEEEEQVDDHAGQEILEEEEQHSTPKAPKSAGKRNATAPKKQAPSKQSM